MELVELGPCQSVVSAVHWDISVLCWSWYFEYQGCFVIADGFEPAAAEYSS